MHTPSPPTAIEPLESRIAPAFAAAFSLADLNGVNGFRIDGIDASDLSGISVSGAGDINRDGFEDLIIGASGGDPGGASGAGESYVVFGHPGAVPAAGLDLATLNGVNGFRIDGIVLDDRSGRSVSGAGDVNGDGFDDLIIGAYGAHAGGDSFAGESYVVFGRAGAFPAGGLDLATLNGVNGFRIDGVDVGDRSGRSVSGAGDVNGDGFDDLIIGAVTADPGGDSAAGKSYVIFGHVGAFPAAGLDLATLNGANGFRIDGIDAEDRSGVSVSGAGDVNGDGFDDLIIGAYGADPGGDSAAGESFVVFGHEGAFPAAGLDLATLNGVNGFRIDGIILDDRSGRSVSGAGDVNGDGFDDLIIGALAADPGGKAYAGESYVVFGHAGAFPAAGLDLATLNGANGFRIDGIGAGDYSGVSVSAAGDINGDGFDDLIIGADRADPGGASNAGESYVVFGHAGAFPAAGLDLATLNGANGFRIDGIDAEERSGVSVSGAGDVNGDGFDDLIIGAYRGDPAGDSNAGESYVVFGSNGGNVVALDGAGRKATFTDADGDLVTITISRGALTTGNFLLTGTNAVGGATLRTIDLAGDAQFAGARLKITAKRGPAGGDGFANIGHLDAAGIDLGKVSIKGDLGRITAGDGDADRPALKALTVTSLGLRGLDTQGGLGASLTSHLAGSVSKVTVNTNVSGVEFLTTGNLGTFSVQANVADSTIGAGYNPDGAAVNGDALIKKVSVLGDWLRSNLAAGVNAGADGQFGTGDDTALGGGAPEVVSRIAKVIITGQVLGTFGDSTRYGFVAQTIGRFTLGGTKLPLTAASDNLPVGPTGDVFVRKVA